MMINVLPPETTAAQPAPITVVLNWTAGLTPSRLEELKRLGIASGRFRTPKHRLYWGARCVYFAQSLAER